MVVPRFTTRVENQPCSVKIENGHLTDKKMGPPGVLGIRGEWLFIFRELGCTGNYFRGAREQAYNFGDQGSKQKK